MKNLLLPAALTALLLVACSTSNAVTSEIWTTPGQKLPPDATFQIEQFELPATFSGSISEAYRQTWQTAWPEIGKDKSAEGFNLAGGLARANQTTTPTHKINIKVTYLHNGEGKGYGWYAPETYMTSHVTISTSGGETIATFAVENRYRNRGQMGPDGFLHLSFMLGEDIKRWYDRNK